ncbi:WHG domain-containing protein [Cutibacterium avidum]|uniref:TetR-like C-terminal domain-containing protein n=1 Tax=Cutibacterium avidum TaxID=33010 RepID=UPI00192A7B7B|nr:TetR-like C-terminal domain-containing protein [Cutibacterium avidum]QQY14109.1 WHG domain-containing protein [Cutibacterium avidum]
MTRTRSVGALLAACGAYVDFALAEPGWFDAAFSVSPNGWRATAEPVEGDDDLPTAVLSDLVRQEALHWHRDLDYRDLRLLIMSTVHGFSTLLASGPLRSFDKADQRRRMRMLLSRTVRGAIDRAS